MAALEEIDTYIEQLHALKADVFMIAGDHSTPAILAGHSWHPVPFMCHPKSFAQADTTEGFNEKACSHGVLGTFPAKEVLSLAMAHAGRLTKYGA
jgi:2,3-bisphosphoglycerate-independent phosphoglycerate mutase